MKIIEVQIENFGKFHNFVYKFNGSCIEELNGENEFGKTTLVTFIQRVFYGFPDKRFAGNHYHTENTPFGGRLLIVDDNGRHVTIERLGTAKGGTLKIFDSQTGEALEHELYIRQGAEFYRNIYMIHLQDLLTEAALLSDEVRHHLYGVERAFGSVSPLKIRELLIKKCDALYKRKGTTQPINKLAKELHQLEADQTVLNSEISSLADESCDMTTLEKEETSLQKNLKLLENICLLHEKYQEQIKKSQIPFPDVLPSSKILSKRAEINSLTERRHSISEAIKRKNNINAQIALYKKNTAALQFTSISAYEKAVTLHEQEKKEYAENVILCNYEQEQQKQKLILFKKTRKIGFIAAGLSFATGIAGIWLGYYFAALFFIGIAVPFLIRKPWEADMIIPTAPADMSEFFREQKKLLEQLNELEKLSIESEQISDMLSSVQKELSLFKEHLPENICYDPTASIGVLQQKLKSESDNEVRYEIYKKSVADAANEAENIKQQIKILQDSSSYTADDIPGIKCRLEEIIRMKGEFKLRHQLLDSKLETLSKLQSEYLSGKTRFNQLCRTYLKWYSALKNFEHTIGIFEKERQGEVMENASKYFARITGNAYLSVRKSVINNNSLVVFDGQNDKTLDKLSSGTREQLLFVLRLALIEYIEKSAKNNISMPILMDDIFVNYDRKRELAARELLTEFSTNRQIIFCRAKF